MIVQTTALPRHTLVWPRTSAHAALAAQANDAEARAAVAAWIQAGRPFVVRRQDEGVRARDDTVALGLPLPPAQRKRRLAFTLARSDVGRHAPPRTLAWIAASLPARWHGPLAALDRAARAHGATLRGFGAAAWQAQTGLAYLHDGSDVDVVFHPAAMEQIDAVLGVFARFERAHRLRVDAEIVFPGEAAVAWREWHAAPLRVLAKSSRGPALHSRAALAELLSAAAA